MEAGILILIIMIMAGSTEILVGIIFYMKEKKLKEFGVETQAKILKLERVDRKNYKPIVEYQTESGKITAKSFISASRIFFPFDEGDIVTIYYDSRNVKKFRFENDKIWKIIIAIMFLTGVFSFIMGGVFYFFLI